MAMGSFFGGFERAAQMSIAAALFLALTHSAAEAQAGSRACRQLEAQLAATSGGGASPAQIKRYDDAITGQKSHINRTRARLRQAECTFAFVQRANPQCGTLSATLARMEANLEQLQKKRSQLGTGGNNRSERARIRAALDANKCRAPRRPSPAKSRNDANRSSQAASPTDFSGDFRTLCVRSCDGYYFPVSWSVSEAAFERDGRTCQAMCPGTSVDLHYHRVSGEESEDMVSVATGTPYRESQTAFLYRTRRVSMPARCGCGATAQTASGFRTIGGDYASNKPDLGTDNPTGNKPTEGKSAEDKSAEDRPAAEDLTDDGAMTDNNAVTAAIPQPLERPDPAEDPETLAAREGGLNADTLRQMAAPPSSAAPLPVHRQIRRVGPVFFPDQ